MLEHRGCLFRQHGFRPAVDAKRELRRVGGAAELVRDVAEAAYCGVCEVEGHPVEAFAVRDRVQRAGGEVDGDDVELPTFESYEWNPRRDRVAQALDELEAVVGPVDPVRDTRFRRPDHEPGAVDPEGQPGLADDLFRVELGSVVRMIEDLAFVEHVLGELAFPAASRDRDRAHMVEAGAERAGQLDDLPGAVDVRALVVGLRGLEAVDRCQMEDVRPFEAGLVGRAEVQAMLGDVAVDGLESRARADGLNERFQAFAGGRPDQDERRAVTPRKLAEQMPADEPRAAGDEPHHRPNFTSWRFGLSGSEQR